MIVELPYRELIGSLMYLAVCTRPDIAFAVNYLSQFNCCYNASHWTAAKQILRYLQGTKELGLRFRKTGRPIEGVDADWANCISDRRSYTGFAFILKRCPISWEARKQKTVALSSTEAEYIALLEASKEVIYLKQKYICTNIYLSTIYLKRFLSNAGFNQMTQVKIFCDNNGARKLAENPVFHNRSKHIDVYHHYIRDVIGRGELKVEYTPTYKMAADILIKGLSKQKHTRYLEFVGLMNIKIPMKSSP